jgi:DNA-directed RNA polymerase specialized sigma24 family protein
MLQISAARAQVSSAVSFPFVGYQPRRRPLTALEDVEQRAAPQRHVFREEPVLTQIAFRRLLEWLDDGVDSHGERYLEMRHRLVAYFDRRNRPAADDLTDETFNRIARTLEQTGAIAVTPPARYCYVVARFVLLEDYRRERKHVPLDEPRRVEIARSRSLAIVDSDERLAQREQRLDRLDHCLQQLRPDQRELAIEYYRDAKRQRIDRRRDLAVRLGISMNALGIRACRIREALMTCFAARRKVQATDLAGRDPMGSTSTIYHEAARAR